MLLHSWTPSFCQWSSLPPSQTGLRHGGQWPRLWIVPGFRHISQGAQWQCCGSHKQGSSIKVWGQLYQGYGFSCGHVWMWELDCEEGWAPKNWCSWTVVLEKTLESPLDCKEIQSVHSEGDQPWDFFGRNDAKAETPILCAPHVKSWLIGKDSDAGRDWGQEEKGMPEDEMAGWHHWLDGRESEWTPGGGDGQGSLACCDSWGRKESDTTEWLNWTELMGRDHQARAAGPQDTTWAQSPLAASPWPAAWHSSQGCGVFPSSFV